MNSQDYITSDPSVLVGKPLIKGTRLSVEFILDLISQGWPEEEILRNYHLQREQVRACVAYAQALLSEQKVFPVAA
ncbi:MAG: DUF433 domain-containing protein [Verrucomicrobiae bacterium]